MSVDHEKMCEDCNATGVIIDVETVRECCLRPDRNGECCQMPIFVEQPIQYQCPTCKGTGEKLINEALTRVKEMRDE